MANLEQLYALRDRLAVATGPDRGLSNNIQSSIGGWEYVWCGDTDRANWHAPGKTYADTEDFLPPDVTASLDAVAVLHGRLLPGFVFEVGSITDGDFYAKTYVYRGFLETRIPNAIYAPTPTLAWLRAIVEALVEEAEERDDGTILRDDGSRHLVPVYRRG